MPMAAVETIIIVGAFIAVRCAEKQNWKAEHLFSFIFVPLSLLMMICMPVTRVPDELAHLQKVWQISVGDWLPNQENQGIFYQPANMWEGIEAAESNTLQSLLAIAGSQMDMEHQIPQEASAATGFYPVHNYFAQALGMAIVRCFTLNRLAIFYGARLGGWIATFLLLYYAIKRMPFGKYVIVAFSLSPMVLQEAISASADGITFAVVLAFFAQVWHLHEKKERMKPSEYVALYVLTFCASTFKVFYCPFILLLLAIDERCYGGKKAKVYSITLILLATLLPILGWLLFCKETYLVGESWAETGASVIVPQIKYILLHPVAYAITVLRTLLNNCMGYIDGMIGEYLSWMNVQIPSLCSTGLILALAMIVARDRGVEWKDEAGLRKMRWTTGIGCIFSVVLICTGLYVWWTPYANMWILGIQGRYFLPIMPPLALIVKKNKWNGSVYQPLLGMFVLDILVLGSVLCATMG